MATTPIASLVACSWCGLLAERGVICDSCGSPVSETTGRTTVLRVPEASGERFREGLRASSPAATPPPVAPPRRAAARWLNVDQASVVSGVPERTLRGWASSRTPEDVPIREPDPRFLLIRTPGLKLPDGLWLVGGPTAPVVPAAAPAEAPVPRPDVTATVASALVAPIAPPPLPPKPQPTPAAPVRRGPLLSDTYLEALLAPEDLLPESWGFDSSRDERKIFRRHKILTTAGVVLGFAGVAELIDFLMSHLR